MDTKTLKYYKDAMYFVEHPECVSEKELAKATRLKRQVERFLDKQTTRIQRIIYHKYIQGMSWNDVASAMGRMCTADSVRQELYRAMNGNDTS